MGQPAQPTVLSPGLGAETGTQAPHWLTKGIGISRRNQEETLHRPVWSHLQRAGERPSAAPRRAAGCSQRGGKGRRGGGQGIRGCLHPSWPSPSCSAWVSPGGWSRLGPGVKGEGGGAASEGEADQDAVLTSRPAWGPAFQPEPQGAGRRTGPQRQAQPTQTGHPLDRKPPRSQSSGTQLASAPPGLPRASPSERGRCCLISLRPALSPDLRCPSHSGRLLPSLRSHRAATLV